MSIFDSIWPVPDIYIQMAIRNLDLEKPELYYFWLGREAEDLFSE